MRRSFGSTVIVLLILGAVGWIGWRQRDQLAQLLRADEAQHEITTPAPPRPSNTVTALGRLRPRDEITRVAGPARFAVVVAELLVEEGDWVEVGEVIAVLDIVHAQEAEVAMLCAELEHAELELERAARLLADDVTPEAEYDRARAERDIVAARLDRAQAELELSRVRSPLSGRVLDVHTRAGERVGTDGIIEIADTRAMYAVAEVYETEVTRVRRGQRARVRSVALPGGELTGSVHSVGLKVGRKDVLDSDPVADADARVVEVAVLLDDPQAVAGLTNLRVEVIIQTEGRAP